MTWFPPRGYTRHRYCIMGDGRFLMGQIPDCNWSNAFIGRRGEVVCGAVKVEDSLEKDWIDIVEKSLILDMLEVAFDFDLDTILLGYPRHAEHTERLHRHH